MRSPISGTPPLYPNRARSNSILHSDAILYARNATKLKSVCRHGRKQRAPPWIFIIQMPLPDVRSRRRETVYDPSSPFPLRDLFVPEDDASPQKYTSDLGFRKPDPRKYSRRFSGASSKRQSVQWRGENLEKLFLMFTLLYPHKLLTHVPGNFQCDWSIYIYINVTEEELSF